MECILPHLDVCHVCEETLKSRVASLGRKANEAVLNGSFGDQEDDDVVVSSVQEDDADVDDDTPDIDDDLLGSEEEREKHRSATVLTLVSGINEWPRAAAPRE